MGAFKEVDILVQEQDLLAEEVELSRQLFLSNDNLILIDEIRDSAKPSPEDQDWFFAYWS